MPVYIVTGGSGFIGTAIVRALKTRGNDVRVLDTGPDGSVSGVDYRHVDITDRESVIEACRDADAIIHSASVVHTLRGMKEVVWAVNVDGTRYLLDAALKNSIGRFIYISSGSVVYEGRNIQAGTESLPYASTIHAPYEETKIEAEKMVLSSNGQNGIATCALRPHVVFGPGDTRFIPALVKKGQNGQLRFRVGWGQWLSDYTYVDNVADAVLLADEALARDGIGSTVAGEAFFITNGEPKPFWDFIRNVADRLGFPSAKITVPKNLVYAAAAIKEGIAVLKGGDPPAEDGLTRFAIRYMCTHHYFSIEKARRLLGYSPKVSIAEGIERTCQYLEDAEMIRK